MKNRKRNAAAAVVTVCIAAMGIGASLAYMTEKEEVTNVFTVGDLDIGLEEPEWNPDDGDGSNLYPGYTVYKNPTIKNITGDQNGEEPCYVRMIIRIEDENGNLVTNQEAVDLIKETIRYDSTYTGSYDQTGFAAKLVEGKVPGYSLTDLAAYPMVNPLFTLDGIRSTANELVYNYMGEEGNGILNIGDEAALFTNIVIPVDWNQTHFETVGNFHIDVSAESIQASGFPSQNAAYEALDKEIQEGTLQMGSTVK